LISLPCEHKLQLGIASLLCALSCSSSTTPQRAPSDGGLSLNLPPTVCPDAGLPADGGACVVLRTRSFSRDIVPLFNGCAGEICHDFGGGAIIYQIGVPSVECCGKASLIVPGHPETSYVLNKLTGTNMCSGRQMPLDQTPYSASDVQTIADWICQGAGTTP
jgi:hypothetical protein